MKSSEKHVLIGFLRFGFSTRKLDKLFFGKDNSRGWLSWEVLKKHELLISDKGALYAYSNNQVNNFIKKI